MGGSLIALPDARGGPGGNGGGICNAGDAAIVRSSVADNQAGDGPPAGTHGSAGRGGAGGGIFNSGELLLRQSTVSGNTSGAGGSAGICGAGGNGGGIASIGGTLSLANSTVSGNHTGAGGVSFMYGPCASGNGGGIDTTVGITFDSSTVANNRAGEGGVGNGGGIYIEDRYVSLRNTILAGNTATGDGPDCKSPLGSPTIHLRGNDLIQNLAGCIGIEYPNVGPSIIGKDPLLQPLGKYGGPTLTHALNPGSPAIDAGSCTDMRGDPVTEDQRGVLRPRGATCDIGAFEWSGFAHYLPLVWRVRPGLVTLLYFKATPQNDNAILLEWETAAELNTVAFNLYRSQDPISLGQQLATLPAQGDAVTGATYSYRDSQVTPGIRYYYTLGQMTQSGELITIATANAGIGLPAQTSDTGAHNPPARAYAEADTCPRLGQRNGVGAARFAHPG